MIPKFRLCAEELLKHQYFENLAMNEEDEKTNPSYFLHKDFYHPTHDPKKFYRKKFDQANKYYISE